MTNITTVGLDLAKLVFQVHGADADGKPVVRKKLRRGQVLVFFAGLPCVSHRIGSVCQCSLLGARVAGAWS
jgi:transposase